MLFIYGREGFVQSVFYVDKQSINSGQQLFQLQCWLIGLIPTQFIITIPKDLEEFSANKPENIILVIQT